MDEWNIYNLTFKRECQNNPIGFDIADISLYKANGFEYSLREIAIYPLAKEIDWGGETTYPRPFLDGWSNIDLAKTNITAEDALRIAEEQGGKKARSKDENDCGILVGISNLHNEFQWKVSYYFSPFFEIVIDPFTGKHNILSSNQ